jgi:hypothetical protein
MVQATLLAMAMILGSGHGSGRSEITQTVDLIELNHHYDANGRHLYDQAIFWEWSPDHRRYDVVSWVLIDSSRLDHYPKRIGDFHVLRFSDVYDKFRRVIKSRKYRETVTCNPADPERLNKNVFDERLRTGLAKPLRSILER